jgi:hypothetical protein
VTVPAGTYGGGWGCEVLHVYHSTMVVATASRLPQVIPLSLSAPFPTESSTSSFTQVWCTSYTIVLYGIACTFLGIPPASLSSSVGLWLHAGDLRVPEIQGVVTQAVSMKGPRGSLMLAVRVEVSRQHFIGQTCR